MLCLYNLTHFLNSTHSGSPPGPETQKEREKEGGNKTTHTQMHICTDRGDLTELGQILLNWPAFSWQTFKSYLKWRFKQFNMVTVMHQTFEAYIPFHFPLPFLPTSLSSSFLSSSPFPCICLPFLFLLTSHFHLPCFPAPFLFVLLFSVLFPFLFLPIVLQSRQGPRSLWVIWEDQTRDGERWRQNLERWSSKVKSPLFI